MNEVTFDQVCQATGKTNAEIAEAAQVGEQTIKTYRKTNKPSQSAKDAVAVLLTPSQDGAQAYREAALAQVGDLPPAETPIPIPIVDDKFAAFQPLGAMSVDREFIVTDFKDNEDWHFLHIYDYQPGGEARVNADKAKCLAGDEIGVYGVAHEFSSTYVVMKCPRVHYLAREERDIAKAAAEWPSNRPLDKGETGVSTSVKREDRFIQGAAGVPLGEPVSA